MAESTDIPEKQSGSATHKPGTSAPLNAIQKAGVIGLFLFLILSWVFDGRFGTIFALIGWTSLLMGYVAGDLWRYRHAVHYWWSIAVAAVVHASLLSVYASLTEAIRNAHGRIGRGYFKLALGLVIIEIFGLLVVLKRVALWIHQRTHGARGVLSPRERPNGR